MAQKVLIADDSPTVQKKASGILTGEGLEVVTVSNGVAAIKKLPTVKPKVILADVSMPGKDGYEVCEFVKASPDFLNVPVVLVFSDEDTYDEQKGSQARADGRIRKPFDPAELIATVKKFLAIAEAATAERQNAPAVIVAPRPSFVVTEPVDAEPEVRPRKASPDFAAFGGGVAFAEPPPEDIQTAPIEREPASSATSGDANDFVVRPEHTHLLEAEHSPGEAQIIRAETPAGEGYGTDRATDEQSPSAAYPGAPESAEPVFIEEQEHTPPPPSAIPATERTVTFRRPADLAQPVFSDELNPAHPPSAIPSSASEPPQAGATQAETAPTEAEQSARMASEGGSSAGAFEAAQESAPVSAATLESYSLGEAAAGNVRFARSEGTAESQAPSATESSENVARQTAPDKIPPVYDSAAVYSIVSKVVAKTSPRMSAQMVEDLSRNLADEITAELNEATAQKS